MHYLSLLIITLVSLTLHANETHEKEFPFIQPISVEKVDAKDIINGFFIDSDGDGVWDDRDKCPNTQRGTKVDIYGCIILNDDDYDGVSNRDDKCPKTRENATVNLQGCEPDSDEDGVADELDECPDTSKEFIVNNVGCPQTAILKIHFTTKEFTLNDDSLPEVEEFANFLLENETYQVIIYGYTDSKNDTTSNKKLSQKRAEAVMDALIEYGVKLTRLTAIGMGSKNPIADNSTPEGRAKNRRIEVELLQ